MLTAQAAQAMGLALHELGTNAVKHGAWSVPQGKVEFSWALVPAQDDPNQLRLTWVERGGPQVGPPAVKGFGHVVVESMVAQATGGKVSMEFNPEGLIWTLSLPEQSLVAPLACST